MQFCRLPCDDPFQQAIDLKMPPPRNTPPPDPFAPIFTKSRGKRSTLNTPYGSLLQQDMSPTPDQSLFDNPLQPAVDLHMPTGNALTSYTDTTGEDLLNPPYTINNVAGALSSATASVSSYIYSVYNRH